MTATNQQMTSEQLADLSALATQLQAKAEANDDRDTAVMAYAVQKACAELVESRREFRAADATIHNLEQQLAAVVAENAALKSKAAELVHEASEVYSAYNATITEPDGDFMDMQTLQEMQCVETPATDAAIANIQAQGVEMFAHSMTHHLLVMEKNGEDAITKIQVGTASRLALAFAAQLRQGAEQ